MPSAQSGNGSMQRASATSALLWDLDNLRVRARDMPMLIEALKGLVEADARLIASAHRTAFRAWRVRLEAHGFEVISGGRRPEGADRQLVQRARTLRRKGVRRFVVASNDGDLCRLAVLGSLQVVTLDPRQLSLRLATVADQVKTLVLDGKAQPVVEDPVSALQIGQSRPPTAVASALRWPS